MVSIVGMCEQSVFHLRVSHVYTHTHTHTHTRAHTCTHVHTCTHTRTHLHTRINYILFYICSHMKANSICRFCSLQLLNMRNSGISTSMHLQREQKFLIFPCEKSVNMTGFNFATFYHTQVHAHWIDF